MKIIREQHFAKLDFLGTGSAVPKPGKRNVSALACTFDTGDVFLLDCGEGTQHQLMQSGVRMSRITTILITHLHGDHCFGLFGLLCSLGSLGSAQPSLTIIGPRNIREMVISVLAFSGSQVPFELHFIELEPALEPIVLGKVGGCTLTAFPLSHRVLTFGYSLREDDWRGRFIPDKAREKGVLDKSLFGKLVSGLSIHLSDGRIVCPQDVMEPNTPGKTIVLLQDTSDSSIAESHILNCDLLIHEATFTDDLKDKCIEFGHSTSVMAGEFASRVNAQNLILTHFSSRYTSTEMFVQEAEQSFPGRTVVAAEDFMEIIIQRSGDLRVLRRSG